MYLYACTLNTSFSSACMLVTLLSAHTFCDLFDLLNLKLKEEKNGWTKTVWFTAYYCGHSIVLKCMWCVQPKTHTNANANSHLAPFRIISFCAIWEYVFYMCTFFHSFSDREVENIKITKWKKKHKNSSTISLECIIPMKKEYQRASMRWTAKVQ